MKVLFGLIISAFFALPFTSEAAVIVSTKYLLDKWTNSQKIRVLIVPGHDDEVWGTQHKNTKEVELNRKVANELFNFLKKDSRFEPILSQTEEGYLPEFNKYFEEEENFIRSFRMNVSRANQRYVRQGKIEPYVGVEHNSASDAVANKLYGINRWVNANNVDLVIHIHFNDYGTRVKGTYGKYSGYAVYAPHYQLVNSAPAISVAAAISGRLGKILPMSDLPVERGGVVQDQELIAIGANNSLIVPSLLVEYGYIYESQFHSPFRDRLFNELAFQTYAGIKDFFGEKTQTETTLLPYYWSGDLERGMKDNMDVFTLQLVMHREGTYPGEGKTLNDCPINGNFGPCTETALKSFQKKHGIRSTGMVGPITMEFLNSTFGFNLAVN